jgi:hypothetical protein
MTVETFMMRIEQIIKSDLFQEILYFDTKKQNVKLSKCFYIAICLYLIHYYVMSSLPYKFYMVISNKTENEIDQDFYNRDASLEKILNSKKITLFNNLLCDTMFTAVIPAIKEELTFRFVLLKIILVNKFKLNIHVSIFLSSLIFAVIHYVNIFLLNANRSLTHIQVINAFILGMMFGYSYYYTNNILTPIMFHFINNLMLVISQYSFMNK